MMQVRVKLFALARDLAGVEELALPLPSQATAITALQVLIEQYPALRQWKDHLRLAVNNEYVSNDTLLHENDEVAVIPPVSGG